MPEELSHCDHTKTKWQARKPEEQTAYNSVVGWLGVQSCSVLRPFENLTSILLPRAQFLIGYYFHHIFDDLVRSDEWFYVNVAVGS